MMNMSVLLDATRGRITPRTLPGRDAPMVRTADGWVALSEKSIGMIPIPVISGVKVKTKVDATKRDPKHDEEDEPEAATEQLVDSLRRGSRLKTVTHALERYIRKQRQGSFDPFPQIKSLSDDHVVFISGGRKYKLRWGLRNGKIAFARPEELEELELHEGDAGVDEWHLDPEITNPDTQKSEQRKQSIRQARKIDEPSERENDDEAEILSKSEKDGDGGAGAEVVKRTEALMKRDNKLSYSEAHAQVLLADTALREAYNREHLKLML